MSTHEEAKSWIFDSNIVVPADPESAEHTGEIVVIDPDEPWAFSSRASRECMWITGPRNSDEELAEAGWDTGDIYGA